MKLLAVHPSALIYTRIFLRLEPLGLELVAAAAIAAGHAVRLIDLQAETHRDYFREIDRWQPDAVCFSGNYLANIPEIIDLARATRERLPGCFIIVGGHSVSFVAHDVLRHAEGAIDCVLRGEGETGIGPLLAAGRGGDWRACRGRCSACGDGPPPRFVESLDALRPARHLLRHRRRYFIGALDPCASIEFARGCPWTARFAAPGPLTAAATARRAPKLRPRRWHAWRNPVCSSSMTWPSSMPSTAWRSRMRWSGGACARSIIWRPAVTCCCATRRCSGAGGARLEYMFIGLEAIDAEGLKRFRKRVSLDKNFEALAFSRARLA